MASIRSEQNASVAVKQPSFDMGLWSRGCKAGPYPFWLTDFLTFDLCALKRSLISPMVSRTRGAFGGSPPEPGNNSIHQVTFVTCCKGNLRQGCQHRHPSASRRCCLTSHRISIVTLDAMSISMLLAVRIWNDKGRAGCGELKAHRISRSRYQQYYPIEC